MSKQSSLHQFFKSSPKDKSDLLTQRTIDQAISIQPRLSEDQKKAIATKKAAIDAESKRKYDQRVKLIGDIGLTWPKPKNVGGGRRGIQFYWECSLYDYVDKIVSGTYPAPTVLPPKDCPAAWAPSEDDKQRRNSLTSSQKKKTKGVEQSFAEKNPVFMWWPQTMLAKNDEEVITLDTNEMDETTPADSMNGAENGLIEGEPSTKKRRKHYTENEKELFYTLTDGMQSGVFKKIEYAKKLVPKTFGCLSKSTVQNWLKSKAQGRSGRKEGSGRPRKIPLAVVAMLMDLAMKYITSGIALNSSISVPLFKAFMMEQEMDEYTDLITPTWVNCVFRKFGFTMRRATKATQNIPMNFNDVAFDFRCRILALMDRYDIDSKFVINIDETSLELLSLSKIGRYKSGSKQVKFNGVDDKRAFTCTPAVTMSGQVLPCIQVIWTGKTDKVHINGPNVPAILHQAHTETHWQSTRTLVDFLTSVYETHVKDNSEHWIVVMDVYSTHRSAETLPLLAVIPNLHIVFIPGGCTSLLQPLDISCNKPFKDAIRNACGMWFAKKLQQLGGLQPDAEPPRLDVRMHVMKPVICQAIVSGCERLSCNEGKVVVDGWQEAMCGVLDVSAAPGEWLSRGRELLDNENNNGREECSDDEPSDSDEDTDVDGSEGEETDTEEYETDEWYSFREAIRSVYGLRPLK